MSHDHLPGAPWGGPHMPLIYMVRHGRIADDPATEHDPELGETGWAQAEAVALELSRRIAAPLPILSSPLRRCRETAAPLAHLWRAGVTVEPRVIEVPSPRSEEVPREVWLKRMLASSWAEAAQQGAALQPGYDGVLARWREDVRQALLDCRQDCVIFSHYVPINVLAGTALGSECIVNFRPANASVTLFRVESGQFQLLQRGHEADTRVA